MNATQVVFPNWEPVAPSQICGGSYLWHLICFQYRSKKRFGVSYALPGVRPLTECFLQTTTIESPEASSLPAQLPQTIEDAMTVCTQLELPYLWIDRYCIPQSDLQERLRQIRHMDIIYSHAFLTLIACAGDDPYHGLSGVRNARQPYPSIRLGDCGIFQMIENEGFVSTSTWASRGWTFQEAVLSVRRLYFTERQLIFESSNTLESETTSLSAAPKLPSGAFIYSLEAMAENSESIYNCISLFTGRSLSEPDDILKAMLGIFSVFERKFTIRQVWGLPFSNAMFAPNTATSLLWIGPSSSIRRRGFPSWSWTGWECKVYWRDFVTSEQADDIDVSLELCSGLLISLDDYQNYYESANFGAGQLSIYIHIDAYVTPVMFRGHDANAPASVNLSLPKMGGESLHWSFPNDSAPVVTDQLLALHLTPWRYSVGTAPHDHTNIEDILLIGYMSDHWERIKIIHEFAGRLMGLKMTRQTIRLG